LLFEGGLLPVVGALPVVETHTFLSRWSSKLDK